MKSQTVIDLTQDAEDIQRTLNLLPLVPTCPVIPEFLLKVLKPHQVDGIKFMWTAISDSCEGDERKYHGCVLAHAQGLGKSLQIVSLVYTLASHPKYCCRKGSCLPPHLAAQHNKLRFLILSPVSVVENWAVEFTKWIPPQYREPLSTCVFLLAGNANDKMPRVEKWFEQGGVLIVGYEMFRYHLSSSDEKSLKWKKYLYQPGPHVLVCDEAHRLKNSLSDIYKSVTTLKTYTKICLTGSPLQNNLDEYWSMLDLVYQGYLHELADFRTRFTKPIVAGMTADSTQKQVKLSRRKMFALQKLLDPFVFRISIPSLSAELDSNSLSSKYENIFSAGKVEFVIKCELTPLQKELYQKCLSFYENHGTKGIFHGYYELLTVINHPSIAQKHFDLSKKKSETANDENNIILNDDDFSKEEIPEPEPLPIKSHLYDEVGGIFQKFNSSLLEDESLSAKASITLFICNYTKSIGEKVLIFSRSLLALDYLVGLCERHNITCLRLDGNISTTDRLSLINKFNSGDHVVFLISTLAGSLGVNCHSANRVILFDAGWNPIHDEQAVARSYRYGQKKSVFVYRLYGCDSIEDTIMKQNIHKLSLVKLVLDKESCFRNYSKKEIADYCKDPSKSVTDKSSPEDQILEKDVIIKSLYEKFSSQIVKIFDYHNFINAFEQYLTPQEKIEAEFFYSEEEDQLRSLRRSKRLALQRSRN